MSWVRCAFGNVCKSVSENLNCFVANCYQKLNFFLNLICFNCLAIKVFSFLGSIPSLQCPLPIVLHLMWAYRWSRIIFLQKHFCLFWLCCQTWIILQNFGIGGSLQCSCCWWGWRGYIISSNHHHHHHRHVKNTNKSLEGSVASTCD